MKTILYILYGGKSVEHEVSLKTAYTVIQSIDQGKFDVYPIYITQEGIWCSRGKLEETPNELHDLIIRPSHEHTAPSLGEVLTNVFSLEGPKVVLPLLHGSNGEDGTIQGLLELLDIPYVGNGVLSSALALDKVVSKELLAHAGISQAEYRTFTYVRWIQDLKGLIGCVQEEIGYPCYVKPASLGSSIGISRCKNETELREAIHAAFQYDRKIVVEKEVEGREIQVAVMGNEQPLVSIPGEFIQDKAFFDFNAKYVDGRLTMSIPAVIPETVTRQIQQTAKLAYRTLNCSGLARVDFFIDREGQLYLNEINTLPGFTKFSMYPIMWERTNGTTYSELIEKLIDYAFTRHLDNQTIQYTR
ncbi:D-alanine--D-alanine ligase [Cohnella silvisoli]|uniref:D-alanine--D-alanine ligase n=1 Tax=Cohnella silvisoli TaxID=2873699 RepID=A0ABV1KZ41_9BACL|nr:D-alanine--D-alanine ligase [Cohnella silvisoli]MCD9026533.1 D-alanine--D-alanine ligase [Cohnella silvisoli]